MLKAILIQREQKEVDYDVLVAIAIFSMLAVAVFVVTSFLAGAVDIAAPIDVTQLGAP